MLIVGRRKAERLQPDLGSEVVMADQENHELMLELRELLADDGNDSDWDYWQELCFF